MVQRQFIKSGSLGCGSVEVAAKGAPVWKDDDCFAIELSLSPLADDEGESEMHKDTYTVGLVVFKLSLIPSISVIVD